MACDPGTKTILQAVQGNGSEVVSEDLIPQSPISPCAQGGGGKGRNDLDSRSLEAQMRRTPQESALTCDLRQDESRTSG